MRCTQSNILQSRIGFLHWSKPISLALGIAKTNFVFSLDSIFDTYFNLLGPFNINPKVLPVKAIQNVKLFKKYQICKNS